MGIGCGDEQSRGVRGCVRQPTALAVAAAEAKPPAGMPERLAICAMDCDTLKRPVLLSVSFSPAELMPPDGYAARRPRQEAERPTSASAQEPARDLAALSSDPAAAGRVALIAWRKRQRVVWPLHMTLLKVKVVAVEYSDG